MASAINVDAKPVRTESKTLRGRPGQSHNDWNPLRFGPVNPATGKCPNAGSTVPHNPARTGPSITSTVINGKVGRKARLGISIRTPAQWRGFQSLLGDAVAFDPIVRDPRHPAWVGLGLGRAKFCR